MAMIVLETMYAVKPNSNFEMDEYAVQIRVSTLKDKLFKFEVSTECAFVGITVRKEKRFTQLSEAIEQRDVYLAERRKARKWE